MNPDDLLKAAPELAKGATALGAAIPFTAIAKRMLGPAEDVQCGAVLDCTIQACCR
jgi:hypothetical protein